MAVVDTENLSMRMHRINELTRSLLALPTENEQVRRLATHVSEEIAIARLQIRLYVPSTRGSV